MDGVVLSYGSSRVLNGVTLQVPAKAKVAIVGRTGAGKSSLFQVLFRISEVIELLTGITLIQTCTIT